MTAVQADGPNAPRPVGRYEWESVLRRVSLPDDLMLAALLLGTYADPDGTRVRPGEPELAAALGKSKATARRRVSALQEMGFVRLVSRGGGRGPGARASVYRLTLPIDLLDRFEVRPPPNGRRIAAVTPLIHGERSFTKNSAHPSVSSVTGASPVDNSETQLTQGLSAVPSSATENSAQITPSQNKTPLKSAETPLTLHERPPATSPTTTTTTTNPDPAQPDTPVDNSVPPKFAAEPRAADPPTCDACTAYLDPDGTCFVCRGGRRTSRGDP